MKTRSTFASVILLFATNIVLARDLYVSPSGDDRNPGTERRPFRSVAAARAAARPLLAEMKKDIVVHVAPGEYLLEKTLVFGEKDSGRKGHNVIYRSSGGPGKASLLGGRTLTGWEKVDAKIWRISLPDVNACHTLYENGMRIRKARYPNYVYEDEFPTAAGAYLSSVTGSNKKQATPTESWIIARKEDFAKVPSDFGTMKINIFPWGKCDWHRWICSVTKLDPASGRITFNNDGDDTPMVPSYGNPKGKRGEARYFLEEHRAFLDAPGEFYFDSIEKALYLIPKSNGHPDKLNIVLPVLDDIIRIEGASHEDVVHNIEFDGLTLEYSKAISPTRFWWAQQWGYTDHALVWMNNARNISIVNCHLKNSGRNGIMMVGQNTHHLVYGCWIEQMGVNGITLSNWSVPVMEASGGTARLTQNVISNNKIHDVGQLSIYCAGINIYSASQNTISHNEIFRSPRYAITMRGNAADKKFTGATTTSTAHNRPPSQGNVFEYLRVYDCSQDSGDSGAIHAALVNSKNGPCTNTFRQITIDNTRAAPHMTDIQPDGIFLDWPGRTMHQRFVDVHIENSAHQPFRSNGRDNDVSAVTENVSWKKPFTPARMEYASIGLKPDFPEAFGGRRDAGQAAGPVRNLRATARGETSIDGTGLVAAYAFDEGEGDRVIDISGNGNDGTCMGNVVWRPKAGKLGGAVQLDGKTAYVECPSGINLSKGNFTIAAWIYKEAAEGQIVLAKGNGFGSPRQWSVGWEHPEGAGNIAFRANNNYWHTEQDSIPVKQWCHIALVRKGTTGTFYVNGKPNGTPGDLGKLGDLTNDLPLLIGRRAYKDARYFHGMLDEITIYSRALSPEQILLISHGAMRPGNLPEQPVATVAHAVVPAGGAPGAAFASPVQFRPFRAGERVAFLGDSITASGDYVHMLRLFYATRFPDRPVRLYNCGIGGAQAQSSWPRLEPDCLDLDPTMVIINLGMNDTGGGLKTYRQYMSRIMDRIAGKSGRELALIVPSAYDQTARLEARIQAGKNDTIRAFGTWLVEQGRRRAAPVVDFNTPMLRINAARQKADPSFSVVGRARIHPDARGHMVMTYGFIRVQGIEGPVASVEIDAAAGTAKADNASVKGLDIGNGALSFVYTPGALPYPAKAIPFTSADDEWEPFTEDLNREWLVVRGLDNGRWALVMDGETVGAFTAGALAAGIDLARLTNSPGYRQAHEVFAVAKQVEEAECNLRAIARVRWLILEPRGIDLDDTERADAVVRDYVSKRPEHTYWQNRAEVFFRFRAPGKRRAERARMEMLMDRLYEINKPKPRLMKLRRIDE